jgi:hypothetical protein
MIKKSIILFILVFTLSGAQDLIDTDPNGTIVDWSFLLASHGYDVPEPGILIIDKNSYNIYNDGTIHL